MPASWWQIRCARRQRAGGRHSRAQRHRQLPLAWRQCLVGNERLAPHWLYLHSRPNRQAPKSGSPVEGETALPSPLTWRSHPPGGQHHGRCRLERLLDVAPALPHDAQAPVQRSRQLELGPGPQLQPRARALGVAVLHLRAASRQPFQWTKAGRKGWGGQKHRAAGDTGIAQASARSAPGAASSPAPAPPPAAAAAASAACSTGPLSARCQRCPDEKTHGSASCAGPRELACHVCLLQRPAGRCCRHGRALAPHSAPHLWQRQHVVRWAQRDVQRQLAQVGRRCAGALKSGGVEARPQLVHPGNLHRTRQGLGQSSHDPKTWRSEVVGAKEARHRVARATRVLPCAAPVSLPRSQRGPPCSVRALGRAALPRAHLGNVCSCWGLCVQAAPRQPDRMRWCSRSCGGGALLSCCRKVPVCTPCDRCDCSIWAVLDSQYGCQPGTDRLPHHTTRQTAAASRWRGTTCTVPLGSLQAPLPAASALCWSAQAPAAPARFLKTPRCPALTCGDCRPDAPGRASAAWLCLAGSPSADSDLAGPVPASAGRLRGRPRGLRSVAGADERGLGLPAAVRAGQLSQKAVLGRRMIGCTHRCSELRQLQGSH